MRKIIIITLFAVFGIATQTTLAQVYLTDKLSGPGTIELARPKPRTVLLYDEGDHTVVSKSMELLRDDVMRVTGSELAVQTGNARSTYAVIAGTIGRNKIIDRLIATGKLAAGEISGGWERYHIQVVNNPVPGIKKALVIAGSDRRGTAYGILSVSEAIGVSPWYWWADVPVRKKDKLILDVKNYTSKEPSVKYRGLFINDEDWGLLPWAKKTFEADLGNIGPKTYSKVCELILRLKGNYLCPAMHEASTAFNKIPENKFVADTFAIVMGSVHCEPLLFNNASEWDKKTMGEWDYINNHETLNRVLKERVESNGMFENVYTLALRGLHDRAMSGSSDMNERVKMLEEALLAQRNILDEVIDKPVYEIPQAFTPYKEVLDVYSAGLELPDDVTIIWPDDNYGYMKRLSSPREQVRSGRSGVYYHVSYLGKPHDYLWLSSTPPSLMYEELRKAYDATADRVWLLNVGDIKSCEFPLTLFLDMAWDIDSFDYERVARYNADWLCAMYGEKYRDQFLKITQRYYDLVFARRPELMGWGYEWNSNKYPRERTTDTDFSFYNYSEAERRIDTYTDIAMMSEKILEGLPESDKSSFYQLVYYPVKASQQMNMMHLTAQKNRMYAHQGRYETNMLRDDVSKYYDTLRTLTAGYNSLENGKWNHMMSMRQGVTTSYFELPKTDSIAIYRDGIGIAVQNGDIAVGGGVYALPVFTTYLPSEHYFEVYRTGNAKGNWTIKSSEPWIITDRNSGDLDLTERVNVSVDADKLPSGQERVFGHIVLTTPYGEETIHVAVFNPSLELSEIKGRYIEQNGYVSIDAAGFHRKNENDHITMRMIPNMGFEGVSVQLGDPLAPMQNPARSDAPSLEYDFYSFNRGQVDVYTYVLPTFTLTSDTGYAGHEATNIETKYGVTINDGALMRPSTSSFEYAQVWYENVLRNCRINKTTHYIEKPGMNTLKIICGDPGVVVQKIVVDFGGMQRSYMGPPTTKIE